MYRTAYSPDENTILYLDKGGNKHIRKGGNLSWRINNPGLVKSHSHYARSKGAIGSYQGFAIFSYPEQGHKALSAWLHSKKYYNATVQAITEHYHPNNAEAIHRYLGMKEGLSQEALIQRTITARISFNIENDPISMNDKRDCKKMVRKKSL